MSLDTERLKVLPQAVTPSQLGMLMRRVLRETPPQIPQGSASHQPAAGELWLGARGKVSARARILKGSQRGQGLGAGVRCPSMGGFEPGWTSPPHPEEDPVTLCQDDQAGLGHSRQEMVADGVHAMGHPK